MANLKERAGRAAWVCDGAAAANERFRCPRDFVKSRSGARKGKRLGFPKFKKRGKCRDSFRLYGTLRCTGSSVTLPRLGVIATHESTRTLADRLEDGSARILSATVS